jgi:hypothetical protein
MDTFNNTSDEPVSLKPSSAEQSSQTQLPERAVKNVNKALSSPDYEADAVSALSTEQKQSKKTVVAYPDLNQNDLFPGYDNNPNIGSYSGSIVGNVPIFAYANNLFPIGVYHKQKAAIMEKMALIDQAKTDPIKYTVPQITGDYTKGFQPTLSKAVVNLVERNINEAAKKGIYGKAFINSEFGRKANKVLEYGTAIKTQLDGVSKSIEYVNGADYTKLYVSPKVKKIVNEFKSNPETTFGINGVQFLEDDNKFSEAAQAINKFNSTVKAQEDIVGLVRDKVLNVMERQKKGTIGSPDERIAGYSAQYKEQHTEYFNAEDVKKVVDNISLLRPDVVYNEEIYNNLVASGNKEDAELYKKSDQLYDNKSLYSLVASMVGTDVKYPEELGRKETKNFGGTPARTGGERTDEEKVTTAALTLTNDILDLINSVDGKRKDLGNGAYMVKAGSFVTVSDEKGNTREIPLNNPEDILSSALLASEGKVYGTGVENPTAQVAQFAVSSDAWKNNTSKAIASKFNANAVYDFVPEEAVSSMVNYKSGYPTSRVIGVDGSGRKVFKKVQSSSEYDFIDRANIIGKHSIGTPIGDGMFIKNVESVAGHVKNLKFKIYDASTSTKAKEGVIIPSSVLSGMASGEISFITGTKTTVNQTSVGGKYSYIEGATLVEDKNGMYNVTIGGNKVDVKDAVGNQKSLQLSKDVLEAIFQPQFDKLKNQILHSPNSILKTTDTQLIGSPQAGKIVVSPSVSNAKTKQ